MSGLSTVLSLAFLFHVSAANAASSPSLWSDTKGLTPLAGCRIAPLTETPFKVTDPGTHLVSEDGKSSALIQNRSLVKISKSAVRAGLQAVTIAGTESTSPSKTAALAKTFDQGYLPANSLRDLENYVLEVKSGNPRIQKNLETARMTGTFWQIAFDNGQPMALLCSFRGVTTELMLFDVFTADQETPMAQVAVDPRQTLLFSTVRVHSVDEADDVLDSRMTHPPENHRQSLVTGSASGTVKTSPLETLRSVPVVKSELASAPVDLATATEEKKESAEATAVVGEAGKTATIESIIQDSGPKADTADDVDEEEADETIDSDLEHVVCINEDTLAVRDDSLDDVLFRAERNETVLPVQSWDEKDAKKKTIGDKEYTFIKVKFPERSGKNIGWLAQDYVRLEGKCPVPKDDKEDEQVMTPAAPSGVIKNINSSACCGFPTTKRPTHSYLSGMRRFKAGRSKGRRLHAACDLYRAHGEIAVSVAQGKILNGLYKFYQGTYAIEVQHPGGFVARYGELTGKKASNAGAGKSVKIGQTLGYIGTVNSGCCKPMLHFELYAGTKKGSLTTKGNRFQRRSDLIDPTKHLRKWEKLKFGTGY